MEFPEKIKVLISEEDYHIDQIGMSRATVIMLRDKVLKIQEESKEADNEYQMMKWLQDKVPVPQILCHEIQNGKSFLLMSRAKGKMSCEEELMQNPDKLAEVLAEGLKMLWQVDISECDIRYDLDRKLEMARYNVEHDLVDVNSVEPETFGPNGFRSPAHLLEWLVANRPEEEPVLVHGDYCLPNIFAENGRVSGFIDLGKTGIADKWQDIALCYRSLIHNYDGSYGGAVREGFDAGILFEKLGIEPDWEKIRYYILMDELF
ncbi:MAG: aminoglycoside 3'-phosphotransferase [Lachnospiraceae bacterium]|nr:aminoglycoside 3'-phosphotransferase [Lachnospiraceae bacterium]